MIKDLSVLRAADEKAQEYKIPPQNLIAFIDVESNGKTFAVVDGREEPLILFEPHLFYRRLNEPERSVAVAAGLASKAQNKKLYPRSQKGRWEQIGSARKLLAENMLDQNISYECTSWGLGQVLGSHWKHLGFESIEQFIETARSGVEGQIDLMVRYCIRNDLIDELQQGNWTALARGYNGPAYAKGGYHKKLAAAAALYQGARPEPDGMLRMGSEGARVRELQSLLVRAGYSLKVDGDFGTTTKSSLKSFQASKGLKPDGIYGPETEKQLGDFRQSRDEKLGAPKLREMKEVIGGALVAVAGPQTIDMAKSAIQDAQEKLGQYAGNAIVDQLLAGLSFVAAMLVIGGIGWAVYGWWSSLQTKES